ncbi:MAG: hypothetical protein M8860_12990 [marine benthic group bacterium]|nr:hypothetical protein [Gemmatimonadota bacterium]MCL7963753.1 hypothetical protein [Candidatus Carthagonibacter metallireducens]MCL7969171.1 hypothetical protein [Gemmatimonadota bacterium]MCL7975025.1 hypothetical protein [Gemmatimonadota bacterium]MCL7976485.1 hypothetical protein [Gemmatimonadota bacterium]
MRANGRASRGATRNGLMLAAALVVAMAACGSPAPTEPDADQVAARGRPGQADEVRFTGTVDLVWPGGKGMNAPDDDRYAQATLAAFHQVDPGNPGAGNFTYRVLTSDGTPHREIGVELYWVFVDADADTVRFLGEVISDTKECGGSGHGTGEHDDGSTHEDGGCSHDDDGSTHDDGGCSHDDDGSTHDDGGCSHDDGSSDHGEPGGPGGQSGHVNGSDCRLGQIVIGWAEDGGTPATSGDRISWKWFAPDAPKVLAIDAAIDAGEEIAWPCKLCEKEITGGNLKAHGN